MILSRIIDRLGVAWAIGLVLALASLLFLAWLAGEVIEGDTRHFDDWAATSLHNHASPPLTSFMSGITLLGSTRVLLALGAFVVIVFLYCALAQRDFALPGYDGRSVTAQSSVEALFSKTTTSTLLRSGGAAFLQLSQRPRPPLILFLGAIAFVSCPSSSIVITTNGGLAIHGVLVLLVGISRIYLGVHYASDVIAGFTAAFIWLMAVNFAPHIWSRSGNRNPIYQVGSTSESE